MTELESTSPCIKCGGDLESNMVHSPLGGPVQRQLRLITVCTGSCGREEHYALALGKVEPHD